MSLSVVIALILPYVVILSRTDSPYILYVLHLLPPLFPLFTPSISLSPFPLSHSCGPGSRKSGHGTFVGPRGRRRCHFRPIPRTVPGTDRGWTKLLSVLSLLYLLYSRHSSFTSTIPPYRTYLTGSFYGPLHSGRVAEGCRTCG